MEIINPVSAVVTAFHTLIDYKWGLPLDLPEEISAHQIGIVSSIQIDVENFGCEKDGNTQHSDWCHKMRRYFHCLVIHDRRAFLAVSEQSDFKQVPLHEYKNVSNHDSCWKDTLVCNL